MDIYSLLLAVSFGFCGLAAISLVIAAYRHNLVFFRISTMAAILALTSDFVSMIVHFYTGHASGTSQELSGLDFFVQHPAFLIAAVVSLLFLWFSRILVARFQG